MKIAIIRLSALGDIVNTLVVLEFIKKNIKNISIDFICEEAFCDLFTLNPYIRKVISINLKIIKKKKSLSLLYKLIKKLRALNDYDLVIDMQGLIKSAIISRLISKNVFGYDFKSAREGFASFFYAKKFNITYTMNSILRNLLLVSRSLNIDINKGDIFDKKPYLFYDNYDFSNLLSKDKKNILFIIGSSWDSKNYPKERFLKLSLLFDENIFITYGNKKEEKIADFIVKNSKAKKVPKLSLKELIAFIAKIDLLIGNDTGPSHIAFALNKPSIILFGCTPKERMFETKINVAIESKSKINHFKLNKKDFSINQIKEEDIFTKAKGLLYG